MDVMLTRAEHYLHVITVRGDIDPATAGELLARPQLLPAPASRPVARDLSQVTFINRTGLRALMAGRFPASRRCTAVPGDRRLVRPVMDTRRRGA